MKDTRYDATREQHVRAQPPDYTHLPDDRPDLDEVFLAVDVNRPAPPGDEGTEANWVVRHGAA